MVPLRPYEGERKLKQLKGDDEAQKSRLIRASLARQIQLGE